MIKIVITEFMDAPAVARLQTDFDVVYEPGLVDDRAALMQALVGARGLIVRNRTSVDGAVLAAGTELRVVGRLGVGLDNIDLAACAARDIRVIPATGANAQAVAEYVIATAMLLLRGAYRATADVAAGRWPRTALSSGQELGGKILGVVGFGSIGQRVARMAIGLGMTVAAYDPILDKDSSVWRELGVRSLALDDLVAQADVVSLHVPLVAATRHLFDEQRLAGMKRGAILINTARGGIVDETALVAALQNGHLAGAALDVFEAEPVPEKNIFSGVPGLLLTPHIAGVTRESNQRVGDMIASEVAGYLSA
ncbi:hydroxyacid dehydrogenase [Castellaniella sp.]|uniref:hydroxyacid dehydrogenase n=1 Tax=Castellaniella sp. TaxID=1955812 RepID=UPI003A94CF1B